MTEKKLVHGGNVYDAAGRLSTEALDFSANINPLGIPQGVLRAMEESLSQACHYPDPLCRALVGAIARWENVPEGWILCGNGAADLLFRLALAQKPKRALLLAPTFAEYAQALTAVGCQVERFFLSPETGFALTEEFLEALDESLDLVCVCNPNNPTGLAAPKELMERILLRCQQLGIFLLADECFTDFLDAPEEVTLKDSLGNFSNLMILKAFTKLYAIPGIRLGYSISSNEKLLGEMFSCGQPWSVSVPAQAAGIQALKEEEYRCQTKELIPKERAFLSEQLTDLGFQVYPSQANYLFFHSSDTLLDEKLKEGKILIRSCQNYPGLEAGYFRIAVKSHEENQRLIEALAALVKERSGSSPQKETKTWRQF